MQLKCRRVLLFQESLHIVFEDAQDQPVHNEPAVLPEQSPKSVHLVQGDHLREHRHDPILCED